MSSFESRDTPLEGVREIARSRMGDARGFLSRLFCADELRLIGFSDPVAQVNHSYTASRGTVRGMHFQHAPHAEDKLVLCIRGEIWDVAVDVRAGSPTMYRWHGAHLSAENRRALFIPRGFAHGFQTLSTDCELIYFHSHAYVPSSEAGLNPTDPALAIAWPLQIDIMSARDQNHPPIGDQFTGVKLCNAATASMI